ncbi:2OG-Fe(II) oxygenase [Primorskyibacter sp. 2E233]|uniref:2OG-Fe(II) oxygenase n=1 Tax=Primorskyibacter sp. 2E233 TaxID=3413431 RepID=UPI003BF3E58C
MLSMHAMPEAFSVGECDAIVAAISQAPTDPALLVGRNRDHNMRGADLVWTDEVDGLGWVMDRLIDLVRVANRDHFGFDLTAFEESPQVAIYRATAAGHFVWHSDIGRGPISAKRKLTLVLQLSPHGDYEGGTLQVMPGVQVLDASRAQGCVTVFPSFTLHQVTPVRSGVRHSLTVWAHGPAFR